MSFLSKLFGDPNVRAVRSMRPLVDEINQLEPGMMALSPSEFAERALLLKRRVREGGEPLDKVLPEAFALCREASRRTLGQRHYDVQLIGGIVLHKGQVAEMRTGEGKTLTATTAVYLNALAGKGVHVVTVNDYLARRDAAWMGQVYAMLGLSSACINHESSYVYDAAFRAPAPEVGEKDLAEASAKEQGGSLDVGRDATGGFRVAYDYLRPATRGEAYAADVTYGTNNEFGFDYLRDNMVTRPGQRVQRELSYALIDEVDSILIDEARTPLIISAPAEEAANDYFRFAEVVRQLVDKEDFNVDEKMRAAALTEAGIAKLEKLLNLPNIYEAAAQRTVHHVEQALRAEAVYKRDRDYVVKDGEVVIVDEFTGRLMAGRRYSEGLHQAIEAKEGVAVQRESQTLATVTFQNYFRLYGKLAGMTGTAATEAEELSKTYKLEVTVVPTHRPPSRVDHNDQVYANANAKYRAVAAEIKRRHALGQPVLVGTVSIEKNEILGELLRREGVPHKLLNAKNHEAEGETIAQAGRLGAVTVATNMAGRGVDILLGGNPPDAEEAAKVRELGGLCVIGTERHESRRIDNQLRGRAGRQGDPGESLFFLSFEDDLMRIFGTERAKSLASKLPEDQPMSMGFLTRSIGIAQRRVEAHHFDTRKHLLEYDDVLNKHRETLYRKRREIVNMASEDADACRSKVLDMVEHELEQVALFHAAGEDVAKWDLKEVAETAGAMFPLSAESRARITDFVPSREGALEARTELIALLKGMAEGAYARLASGVDETLAGAGATHVDVLRGMLLRAIDQLWVEHLDAMHHLRQGIGLQGYGQRDPLVEYKRESYRMFNELIAAIGNQVANSVFKLVVERTDRPSSAVAAAAESPSLLDRGGITTVAPAKEGAAVGEAEETSASGAKKGAGKYDGVGRNDACPCGSGKKFKKCHGA
jgi:preprotein translocase subunit SecA